MFDHLKNPICAVLLLLTTAVPPVSAQPPLASSDGSSFYRVIEHAIFATINCIHYSGDWLHEKIVTEESLQRYGLVLDEDEQLADSEQPIAVVIHGFNSNHRHSDTLLAQVREAGYTCATFSYPNDGPIQNSAELLASELQKLAEENPARPVTLITYSMGGLVARACIEDPQFDPGNVERLIMVAPPSHGSKWAHISFADDVWEHGLSRRHGYPWTRVRDSIVDGLDEAADDMCPGSEFLVQLNGRERNAAVDYSILLGNDAMVSPEQMQRIRSSLQATIGRVPGVRTATRKLNHMLAELDEIIDGRGDGVVAIESGKLEGVEDIAVLPFNHFSMTGKGFDEKVQPLNEAVLARLN